MLVPKFATQNFQEKAKEVDLRKKKPNFFISEN